LETSIQVPRTLPRTESNKSCKMTQINSSTSTSLKWTISDDNSFSRNRERIENEIGSRGYVGTLVLEGNASPDFTRKTVTGSEAAKAKIKSENSRIEKLENVWDLEHAKVFYEILTYVHENGLSRLKEEHDWETIKTSRNPVSLWKKIVDVFRTSDTNKQARLKAYRIELENTKQLPNESYKDYQSRFQKIVDLATPLQAFQQNYVVDKFIEGLDTTRHGYSILKLSKSPINSLSEAKLKLEELENRLEGTKAKQLVQGFNVKDIPTEAIEKINYNNSKIKSKPGKDKYRSQDKKSNKKGPRENGSNRKHQEDEDTDDEGVPPICLKCWKKYKGNMEKKYN
jgi:hypothetical protein